LPNDYPEAEAVDIVELISSMLAELVSINDQLANKEAQLTRFHSRAAPSISIRDYLWRLNRFCSLEKSILISVVFLVDLFCSKCPHFSLNSLTIHRFLITAATIASKGLCDSFCSNAYYAKIGGITVHELNILELELLEQVDFRIVPRPE
ncbi:hypothetical protein CANCADRAFT_17747, partial [Tortispora caseinolytica NRRL Y-17796]